jgi:hypothetical protein
MKTCIEQGKGVSAFRSLVAQQFMQALPQNFPPAFSSCLESGANHIPASQLAGLVSLFANPDPAVIQAQGRQLGAGLATQCLDQPAVVDSLRTYVVDATRQGFQSTHLSAAYQNCVVQKLQQASAADYSRLFANPQTVNTSAQALGRSAGQACLAAGIRP